MARSKNKTIRARYDAFLEEHPIAADALVCASVAVALTAIFLFVTFSGFGSSAEFIYNQF